MKIISLLTLIATIGATFLLSGCIIVPAHRGGYYHDGGYGRYYPRGYY